MSKEIICPECQTANTPGSKFCNNCGNRLPPSTSLICPSCGTPNPRDRFYCDNCGSRLVKEKQVPQEPQEKPLPHTGTFFSLPARPPGQTGDLDPLQIVPDWLRKQAEEAGEEATEEDLRLRMPKIEEIESPKKVTDDLPDWLVDEDDADEILGSPRVITTEHYMNLLRSSEDEDDEELAETANKANLPDWLSEFADSESEGAVTQSDDLSTPDDALNEWLASISGDETAEASDSDRVDDADITTDWLFDAVPELAEDEEVVPDSDSLPGLDAADEALGGEMFDWLAENLAETGPLDVTAVTEIEPPAAADSEPALLEDDDDWTDWLAVEDAAKTGPPAATDSEPALSEDDGDWADWLAVDDAAQTGLPAAAADDDWLADLAADTADEELALPEDDDDWADWSAAEDAATTDIASLAELTDAVAQQDMHTDEELPDWISEITDQEEGAAVEPSTAQPDWMAEYTTADSETFAEQIESRLGALDKDELPEVEQPAVEAEADDWTADLLAESEETEPEAFIAAAEAATAVEESLPDWMADLGDDETLVSETDESEDIFADLFAPAEADTGDLDWMAGGEPGIEADLPPVSDEAEADLPDEFGETDWLSEMVRMGDGAFVAEDEAEETAVPAQADSIPEEPEPVSADIFATDWPDEEPKEEEPEGVIESDTSAGDWMAGDSMLLEALDEEMPDWLDELGAAATVDIIEESETAPTSESLPEWIAQMKPGSGFSGAGLSDTGGLSELADVYADLPDEIADSDLPEWLEEAAEAAAGTGPLLEESTDIPEWLAESIPAESGLSSLSGRLPESDDEWMAILQDLPPAVPIEERVFKAEVPDWIMALKPTRLTDEPVVQEEGPLSGIRDVIGIEAVAVEPQVNGGIPAFTVSQEQAAQATLLKQLALADRSAVQSFPGVQTSSNGLVRLVLAGLLLVVIVLGVLRPNLIQFAPQSVPPHLASGYEAIEAVAGQPVLLAVEYTPAMAGELDAQLAMLLAQLAAGDSPVVTVSQSAAGTAVIQRMAADYPTLGLLPGQSVGLRQLGECLAGETACDTLAGKSLSQSVADPLSKTALIIVLTGERDSLVDWVEQATLSGEMPVMAGVTQSLAPVALPYLDTEQLRGMIGGLPDTAVYQQELLGQAPDETLMRQLSAQTLAQLLAAVLLLVGGLVFGIPRLLQREGKR